MKVELLIHSRETGESIIDSSINNRLLSVSNVSFNDVEGSLTGTAMLFSSNSFISTPDSPAWTADFVNGVSIDMWIKVLSFDIEHRIIAICDSSSTWPSAGFVWLEINSANQFVARCIVNTATPYQMGFAHQTIINDSNWHHIAVQVYNNIVTSYVDGIESSSHADLNGYSPLDSTHPLVIGRLGDRDHFHYIGYIDEIRITSGGLVYNGDFTPPDRPYALPGLLYEQACSIRVSFLAEAFRSLQLAPAAHREAWKGIQVRRATPAEKAYQIYVDAAARLEKAARLSVIATMGFEVFAGLAVKGTLAAFEQFASLSIEARERMVFETYQRLAVLGEVDASIFEQSVGLIIDNSIVDFISFAEQGGLYYRQFDVQVNVNPDTFPPRNVQLIRSLPLYASASLVLQSTLLLESGPITQVDRVIGLMYDGVQEETRAADQQTGVESVTATLRLVSPTAGLGYLKGDSGSQRFTKSWPSGTMASEIMDELFAGSGLSYDLRIDDFPIGQQLTVDDKFPFEIWPLLFIKERIRTGDDGDTLIIAPVLPCLPADLAAQPLDHDLDPGQYMIQSTIADDGGQIRYNMIRVANYQEADAGGAELAPPELGEADSSGMTTVYGWPVPWRKVWLRGCHLPHDGFALRSEGTVEELELEETISFDNGTGRTQRPIYALLSVDWEGNTSLGAITPSEDGTLTAATAGKSVAVVRYKTRRYKFLYRDAAGDHKMSLWLTDEEA